MVNYNDNDIAMIIAVRRIKTPPYFIAETTKYPEKPVEFAALLNLVKMTCEKTINDFADEIGFTNKIEP